MGITLNQETLRRRAKALEIFADTGFEYTMLGLVMGTIFPEMRDDLANRLAQQVEILIHAPQSLVIYDHNGSKQTKHDIQLTEKAIELARETEEFPSGLVIPLYKDLIRYCERLAVDGPTPLVYKRDATIYHAALEKLSGN